MHQEIRRKWLEKKSRENEQDQDFAVIRMKIETYSK